MKEGSGFRSGELGITDKDEMEQIFVTFDGGFGEEQLWYTVNGGWLDIGLRKTSAVVLKRVNGRKQ